jgi:hypothetical protein
MASPSTASVLLRDESCTSRCTSLQYQAVTRTAVERNDPDGSLDRLQRIVDALGGSRRLAVECGVSSWSVRAWLAGVRKPSAACRERIEVLARGLDLPVP